MTEDLDGETLMNDDINKKAMPLLQVSINLNANIFLFSGEISRETAEKFLEMMENSRKRENVALILCTYGGDADGSYIIAKKLKSIYKKFSLFIFGMCKSAGTLVALGADEIIMSRHGELGPLDVQLIKDDVLSPRSSGLDILNSLEFINSYSFELFENFLLQIKNRSGGTISTKTAADIACSLSRSIIAPLAEQIDPYRLGEVQRAMNIAYEYGTRLCQNPETISKLINGYPTHSFVIDLEETKKLFINVREATETECIMEEVVSGLFLQKTGNVCTRYPDANGIIVDLSLDSEPNQEGVCNDGTKEITQEGAELPHREAGGNEQAENN